ncbi:NIPSNAP family protein [Pedobacter aquatilis]|uniref:NIPSNAP family protein n=1 Tax=Pedobacter aquatilis TaxID=351343 RepID=UPI0025B48BCA|nr:NIPSNAP family protein [Pedobacter aquatilis]MDN3588958.1 NIPSNAP family protein [Pedobacter aquatilis]
MKSFLTKLLFLAITLIAFSATAFAVKTSYYYQIKVYHLKTKVQEATLDEYLKNAFIPASHRAGVKDIGVFKPIAQDTSEKLIYVFIPFKKLADLDKINELVIKDKQYIEAGKNYLNATYNEAPYTRVESIILKAFSAMPEYALPSLTSPKSERVYELRSYEAATENLSLNKIGMFNDAEVDIFTKLNFNAVFYGQVISGSKMPNLMYLTTFNNKADRDNHWAAFGPEYKKISGLPQYQHNVSKNVTLFLYPTDYSDF